MEMDIFRIFLYAGLFVGILAYLGTKLMCYIDKKRERKMEENQEQQQKEEKVLATRNLLMSTLREMGCQSEMDKENGTVSFQYQGGFFYCYVGNKSINIVYPGWAEFDIRDVNINDIYVTINKIHRSRDILCRIICTVEGNTAALTSAYFTVFISEIPFLKDLLEASLQDFFITQRVFELEFQELKQ